MLFEDLIFEARVVCEVVSPAKKKARYAARLGRSGIYAADALTKKQQRMAMGGKVDTLQWKAWNKQDRESGEPASTTKGHLRRNLRDTGRMLPGIGSAAKERRAQVRASKLRDREIDRVQARESVEEQQYGKRKEAKRFNKKVKQVAGLKALARKGGQDMLVRQARHDLPGAMKTLRRISRGEISLDPGVVSSSSRI